MAMGESELLHRAQTAEAKYNTLMQSVEPMKQKIQNFKMEWGINERGNGAWQINFDKFAENLGIEQALELRAIIDEKYGISGAAGEKPKVRVPANA